MRRWIIALVVLVAIAGGLAGGWWWARSFPEQAVRFLSDGGLNTDRAEAFVDWLGGQAAAETEPTLVASGSIEGETVSVVSEFGGRIVGVLAHEGDQVQEGQVLVVLDTTLLLAQLGEAEALVVAAQANLGIVQAGSHPAEILAAQAAVGQALAEQAAAQVMFQDAAAILENPQQIDLEVAKARAAVELAGVEVEQAEASIALAAAERDRYRSQGSMEEKWLYAIHNHQVAAAEASLAAAEANRAGKEQTLAALLALRDNPLAIASQAHLAEANYRMAESGVAVAQAKLRELSAGPTSEEISVARAQVAQAEAAVQALKTRISLMTLRAPISGMVASSAVHSGEAAVPGATLLTISDLSHVKLTVYVPEDELDQVHLGQQVEVQVDSFPGRGFPGTVAYISQQAEFTPRNVQTQKDRVNLVFAVRVHLDNPEQLLKAGMPADAIFGW
jgi:multidrug resistance efflux pump